MTTKRKAQPIDQITPAMPPDFAGVWRWHPHPKGTGEWCLQSADFTTTFYQQPENAIAEARRWLLSQPKSAPDSAHAAHAAHAAPYWGLKGANIIAHWFGYVDGAWEAACGKVQGSTPPPSNETWRPRCSLCERWAALEAQLDTRGLRWKRKVDGITIWEPSEEASVLAAEGTANERHAFDLEWAEAWLAEQGSALLPSSSFIEDVLRLHGWNWETSTDRGQQGYRFHNQYTHEACWLESLEQRLEFDERKLFLYELLADGFVPGPDANGVFRRPPSVHEQMTVAVEQIIRGRYQPRTEFNKDELQELADSIEEHGILTRLKVFVNERAEYELIAGERRLRAAKLVGLVEVPVEVCEWTLVQIHAVSLIDNLQRKGLTPIEEGDAYERLASELGVSEAELARRLGKNRAYIQQRRALATAAPELRSALADGTLTFSQARGVCLGAGDSHKAQKTALKALAELVKSGRRVGEKDAQQEASKALVKEVKKDLVALGWHIAERGSTPDQTAIMVWGGGERPRAWTGAELLAAHKEGRRPNGQEPARYGLNTEERHVLSIQSYWKYDSYEPWLVLSGNGDTQILAPDELPQLLDRIRADYAAMQARYEAAGWTLKKGSGSGYNFEARSSQGRTEFPWMWKGVEELIERIEAGQVSAKPDPKKAQHSPDPTWTCSDCGKKSKSTDYTWIDSKKICRSCEAAREAKRAARITATAQLIAADWNAWLESAPLDLLRVVGASVVTAARWDATKRMAEVLEQGNTQELDQRVLALEHGPLVEVLPMLLAIWGEEHQIAFTEEFTEGD